MEAKDPIVPILNVDDSSLTKPAPSPRIG